MILLKTILFTIFLPGIIFVFIPWVLVIQAQNFVPLDFGLFRFLGLIPLAAGAFIYFWCAFAFVFIGKGTPAVDEPPKFLVLKGLYRWVRNPMYIGYLSFALGEAIFFESAILFIYTILLVWLHHLFVVETEEPELKKKFGPAYEEYRKKVPRWFPKFSRK